MKIRLQYGESPPLLFLFHTDSHFTSLMGPKQYLPRRPGGPFTVTCPSRQVNSAAPGCGQVDGTERDLEGPCAQTPPRPDPSSHPQSGGSGTDLSLWGVRINQCELLEDFVNVKPDINLTCDYYFPVAISKSSSEKPSPYANAFCSALL